MRRLPMPPPGRERARAGTKAAADPVADRAVARAGARPARARAVAATAIREADPRTAVRPAVQWPVVEAPVQAERATAAPEAARVQPAAVMDRHGCRLMSVTATTMTSSHASCAKRP